MTKVWLARAQVRLASSAGSQWIERCCWVRKSSQLVSAVGSAQSSNALLK